MAIIIPIVGLFGGYLKSIIQPKYTPNYTNIKDVTLIIDRKGDEKKETDLIFITNPQENKPVITKQYTA